MGRFSISCLTLWIAISGLSAQTRVLDSLELKLSQVKDDSNKAQLLNTLALNLWTTDSVRAKNLFTEAQTLADKLGNGSLQFDLWMANAKWYYDHKDYNRSLEYTVQARTKAGELEDAARLSEALLLMGNIFNEMEEKDRAIDFTKQALEAARRSGDRKRQFGVLNYLGKLHMWTTRFDEAEEYFVLAMDLARELGNKKYQAGILHNLGNNASDANQNDKAIDFYQQSLKLKREMGDVEGECNMLSLIAYHYKQKSNFPLSLEYYQKARDLARESPHNISVHIIIEEGIGKVYESMGNHEMALVHFQDGLNQARLADHFTFQIMLLSDIGDNYVLQEKYDTALAYFFSILPIIQNKKHAALSLAKVNNHLGNTYEKLGQLDSAGIYLQEALDLMRQMDKRTSSLKTMGQSLVGLGKVNYRLGKYQDARSYLEEALGVTTESGFREDQMAAAETLYKLFKDQQNYRLALQYYEIHKKIQEAIFNEKNVKQIVRLEAEYAFAQEKQALQFEQEQKLARERSIQWLIAIALIIVVGALLVVSWYYREKQRTNVKLMQLNQQLEELDELKALFFTNISHEFRTPLTIITGLINLIEQNPQQWMKKGAEMIRQNSDNLLGLINKILDLRKLESGTMEVEMVQGDIIFYLRYLAESFHSVAASRNIRINFHSDTQSLLMDYDKEKILQIYSNLLSNAIKFTPEGGQIYVQVEYNGKNEAQATALLIRVRDTGIGIPREKLPAIFDHFFQVSDGHQTHGVQKSKGSGIGLSLVKELVQLLHGHINVESELGEGSTFEVILPVTNVAPLEKRSKEVDLGHALAGLSRSKVEKVVTNSNIIDPKELPHLLIVEDNPDVLTYLLSLLEKEYQIEVAENGKEGLEKGLASIPDLIISDVMMPLMDGFELCEKLKNDDRTSHIPIVLLTSKDDHESKIAGLERGADAYLTKPFNPKELFVRLKKLLASRLRMQERYGKFSLLTPTRDKNIQQEDVFINKLKDAIESKMDDEAFGIKELTKAMGIPRAQLHLKIKALTNRSTSQFIRAVRLQKARMLLQQGELNVTEVAYEVGIPNRAYFSRAFTKEFGHPPKHFVKKS